MSKRLMKKLKDKVKSVFLLLENGKKIIVVGILTIAMREIILIKLLVIFQKDVMTSVKSNLINL